MSSARSSSTRGIHLAELDDDRVIDADEPEVWPVGAQGVGEYEGIAPVRGHFSFFRDETLYKIIVRDIEDAISCLERASTNWLRSCRARSSKRPFWGDFERVVGGEPTSPAALSTTLGGGCVRRGPTFPHLNWIEARSSFRRPDLDVRRCIACGGQHTTDALSV